MQLQRLRFQMARCYRLVRFFQVRIVMGSVIFLNEHFVKVFYTTGEIDVWVDEPTAAGKHIPFLRNCKLKLYFLYLIHKWNINTSY